MQKETTQLRRGDRVKLPGKRIGVVERVNPITNLYNMRNEQLYAVHYSKVLPEGTIWGEANLAQAETCWEVADCDLLDALYKARCYVEEALTIPGSKPGAVAADLKTINDAISKAEDTGKGWM